MRVLFVCINVRAHFMALVPAAWGAQNLGHEVVVFSQPGLKTAVDQSGLSFVSSTTEHTHADALVDESKSTKSDYEAIDFFTTDLTSLIASDRLLTESFYSLANDTQFVADLIQFIHFWNPDLVVWEAFSFAGVIAATVTNTKHIKFLWGPDLFQDMRSKICSSAQTRGTDDPFCDWFKRQVEIANGVPSDVNTQSWTDNGLTAVPPMFRTTSDAATQGMRYIPYNGIGSVPHLELSRLSLKPIICLSLGVSASELGYEWALNPSTLFEFIESLPCNVLLTANPSEYEDKTLPSNVSNIGYTPLKNILPHCSAIIHHGGAGTWATALHFGVPQVISASLWDNRFRADRTETLGAGISVDPHVLTPARLQQAIDLVLSDQSYQESAQQIARDLRTHDSPHDAFQHLVEKNFSAGK